MKIHKWLDSLEKLKFSFCKLNSHINNVSSELINGIFKNLLYSFPKILLGPDITIYLQGWVLWWVGAQFPASSKYSIVSSLNIFKETYLMSKSIVQVHCPSPLSKSIVQAHCPSPSLSKSIFQVHHCPSPLSKSIVQVHCPSLLSKSIVQVYCPSPLLSKSIVPVHYPSPLSKSKTPRIPNQNLP